MNDDTTTLVIPADDPRAIELVLAVRGGAIDTIRRLLSGHPRLASARLELSGRAARRTPLHVVTDWPRLLSPRPEIVRLLIDAGADPNVLTTGRGEDPSAVTASPGAETPLHWAASSDDADVARALIDGGADHRHFRRLYPRMLLPVRNAIGYGCWNVARILVARGAAVGKLWHAAALGMLERQDELLLQPGTGQEQISQAFWHACAGGQRRAAERLLHAGADLNWIPDYAAGTPLDTAAGLGTQQENVIEWLRVPRGAGVGPYPRNELQPACPRASGDPAGRRWMSEVACPRVAARGCCGGRVPLVPPGMAGNIACESRQGGRWLLVFR